MAQVTKNDILREQSLEKLIETYYEEYRYDNRLPELFELIEPEKLYEYLIERFEQDFKLHELKEKFNYETMKVSIDYDLWSTMKFLCQEIMEQAKTVNDRDEDGNYRIEPYGGGIVTISKDEMEQLESLTDIDF